MNKVLLFSAGVLIIFNSCLAQNRNKEQKLGLAMAVKMADSEMKHFPDPVTVDFNPRPVWNYTQGLIALSMMQVWQETKNVAFYNYAKTYADRFIREDGSIDEYRSDEHNIDAVNSGKFLFILNKETKEQKYWKAIEFLRAELDKQPRTSEGGFWHKQRYPHQMWLDGLYMGAPFYAQYAREKDVIGSFDDIVKQFEIINKHTYNPEVGLNYHGWDESKQQKWADPVTGCSPNFWGRAMGWYAMALVDVLDFIPESHPGRAKLLAILNQVAQGIKKYQDPKTGVWYQVMDAGNKEGNYLEATASSMFAYTLLKGIRKGYLGKEYKPVAVKAYRGVVSTFIRENDNGTISLTKCCSVAGLGGNPYRDGSFEYYIREPVRDNDPKGVGPFIMASLEYSRFK